MRKYICLDDLEPTDDGLGLLADKREIYLASDVDALLQSNAATAGKVISELNVRVAELEKALRLYVSDDHAGWCSKKLGVMDQCDCGFSVLMEPGAGQ